MKLFNQILFFLKDKPLSPWHCMVNNFDVKDQEEFLLLCHDEDISDRTDALDNFRSGYIDAGLDNLCIKPIDETFEVTEYHESPDQFKADMRSIVKILQDYGY